MGLKLDNDLCNHSNLRAIKYCHNDTTLQTLADITKLVRVGDSTILF